MSDTDVQQQQVEKPEEMGKGQDGERKRWLAELKIADKNDKAWRERADKVIRRYRDERGAMDGRTSKMNILWSNTQTILPALYANTPVPLADRRNKQRDPVGLMAARIVEQAAETGLDDFDFDETMRAAVEDYQLPGRAVARVYYRPTYKQERMPAKPLSYKTEYMPNYDDPDNPIEVQGEPVYDEAVEFDDEGAYTMEEVVDTECAEVGYVYWKDFRMGRAKRWNQVPWVAFRAYLTKEQSEERFGEAIAAKMKFKHRPDDSQSAVRTAEDEGAELLMKAEVWEIWDKDSKKVIWVSQDYGDGLLDKAEPHLKFKDFFPCPKPLIMGSTTGTMVPVPEYTQYQDQADEIDELTNRIAILVGAIRVTGVYDQAASGVDALLNMDYNDNKLYPIANWAQFMDKGGMEKAIAWLPIEQMAKVVTILHEARESALQKIYEVTGIADIIRGNSDPRETAAAQNTKSRFASMRLRDKQKLVAGFARDCIQLMSEVMCEQFSKETLQDMTGIRYDTEMKQQQSDNQQPQQGQMPPMQGQPQQGGMMQQPQQPAMDPQQQEQMQEAQNEAMWEKVMELLRNDPMRRFRIAIETDSTIQPDEMEEKQKRIEFLEATGTFMQGALSLIEANRTMTPLVTEMLMFGVRGFRAGRELEERFQDVMDRINEEANQPQQAPPDPRMIEAQAKAQEAQTKLAMDQQEHQMDMQQDMQKHQLEMKQDQDKHVLDMQQKREEMGMDAIEVSQRMANQRRESLARAMQLPGGNS